MRTGAIRPASSSPGPPPPARKRDSGRQHILFIKLTLPPPKGFTGINSFENPVIWIKELILKLILIQFPIMLL